MGRISAGKKGKKTGPAGCGGGGRVSGWVVVERRGRERVVFRLWSWGRGLGLVFGYVEGVL